MTVWFTVQLDDRPGALARVATALAEREVNITGIVGVAEDTDGALMLTTSDPVRTREAFGGARAGLRGARPERRTRAGPDVRHRRPGPRPLAGRGPHDRPPPQHGPDRPPMPRRPNLPTTVALHVVLEDGPSDVPDLAEAIGKAGGRLRTLSTVRRLDAEGRQAPAVELEIEVEGVGEDDLVAASMASPGSAPSGSPARSTASSASGSSSSAGAPRSPRSRSVR